LEELHTLPISCAGVTIGAARAVFDYLAVMVDEIARLSHQRYGGDQGVHTYVVHKGLVPRSRLVANEAGPVLTMGLMGESEATNLLARRGEAV